VLAQDEIDPPLYSWVFVPLSREHIYLKTRKLCYCKDELAMRPIYECPETLKAQPSWQLGCHTHSYPECQLGSRPIGDRASGSVHRAYSKLMFKHDKLRQPHCPYTRNPREYPHAYTLGYNYWYFTTDSLIIWVCVC